MSASNVRRLLRFYAPLLLCIIFCSLIIAGCAAPFVEKASATSYPVVLGAATTNDTQVNAWLQAARSVNQSLNPTPTREAVDMAMVSIE
jgi:hypothetical protein